MPTDSRQEQAGSPTERRSADGRFEATRRFLCDWTDRYFVRGLILDGWRESYPYRPQFGALAQTVSIQPFDKAIGVDADGLAVYSKAEVVVEYGTPRAEQVHNHESNPQEVFSEMLEPTVEFLTIDYRQCAWSTPYYIPKTYDPDTRAVTDWQTQYALTPDQAPGFQLHGHVYTCTRHNLVQVPSNYLGLVGSINQDALTTQLLTITHPAETCLLLPSPINTTVFAQGGYAQNKVSLSLKVHYRNIPSWNMFWRPDLYDGSDPSSAWDSIQINTSGSGVILLKMYPVASWSGLFPGVGAGAG